MKPTNFTMSGRHSFNFGGKGSGKSNNQDQREEEIEKRPVGRPSKEYLVMLAAREEEKNRGSSSGPT